MKFIVGRASKIPVHTQLQDQIKLAIAVGRLRPGETLPSVRDLEKELKVGKNSIWRVYKELEKAGLIVLRQGKGAQIRSDAAVHKFKDKLVHCESICDQTLQRLTRLQIHPSSFLYYFQEYLVRVTNEQPPLIFAECNRTETEIFSQQISELWNIEIKGLTFDSLKTAPARKLLTKATKVISNVYHMDEMRELLKGTGAEAIGLKFHWDRRLLKRIESVSDDSSVLFVFDDRDQQRYGRLILEEFRSLVNRPKLGMLLKGMSDITDLAKLHRNGRYGFILFSNRIWHLVPQELKRSPIVSRPTLQIDPASLEDVRGRVGVVC